VSKKLFLAAMFVMLAVTAWLALYVTPPREDQGFQAVRLLYLHVPCAILAYVAFGVTAVASVLWLTPRTRRTEWDLLAGASAEVGVVFTGLTLVLGAIWGKPTWGVWWAWDARLTTTAILFFLYLGYLALRRTGATADERGRRCAIAAIIAFVDVPINYLSVTWWQTLHQTGTVFNRQLSPKINGSMSVALMVAFVSFTMLYGYLVYERFQLAQLEEGLEEKALEIAIAERVRSEQVVPV
jgi:heme exporter protein C